MLAMIRRWLYQNLAVVIVWVCLTLMALIVLVSTDTVRLVGNVTVDSVFRASLALIILAVVLLAARKAIELIEATNKRFDNIQSSLREIREQIRKEHNQ